MIHSILKKPVGVQCMNKILTSLPNTRHILNACVSQLVLCDTSSYIVPPQNMTWLFISIGIRNINALANANWYIHELKKIVKCIMMEFISLVHQHSITKGQVYQPYQCRYHTIFNPWTTWYSGHNRTHKAFCCTRKAPHHRLLYVAYWFRGLQG